MSRIRRSIALAALFVSTLAAIAGISGVSAPAAHADVYVGGVRATSQATFFPCEAEVDVRPQAIQNSRYVDVYAYAWVYDYATAQWMHSNWALANWSNAHAFRAQNPYRASYVVYARYYAGAWRFNSEWIGIGSTVDGGVFCRPVSYGATRRGSVAHASSHKKGHLVSNGRRPKLPSMRAAKKELMAKKGLIKHHK
jgi:hypothetical protein